MKQQPKKNKYASTRWQIKNCCHFRRSVTSFLFFGLVFLLPLVFFCRIFFPVFFSFSFVPRKMGMLGGILKVACGVLSVFIILQIFSLAEMMLIYARGLSFIVQWSQNFTAFDNVTSTSPIESNESVVVKGWFHQIWKTKNCSSYPHVSFCSDWKNLTQSSHTYRLWNDTEMRGLVQHHVPHLLALFDSYLYPIERADFDRYLLLYVYGGFYADIDVVPGPLFLSSLSTFHKFDFVLCEGADGRTVSNHFIYARPQSAFFGYVLNQTLQGRGPWVLQTWIPYLRVMRETGPLFLTQTLTSWLFHASNSLSNSSNASARPFALIFRKDREYYANHESGRSWHQLDGQFFNRMVDSENPYLFYSFFLVLFLLCGMCCAWKQRVNKV
jgi:mannosyltransferase OCH1-like enzyme